MHRKLLVAVAVVLAAVTPSLAVTPSQAQTDGAEPQRLDSLIKKLGSPKFSEREEARKELEAFGTAALDALKKAAQSDDLETSRRASEIVRKLEERIATDNILAAKRVRLNLKDTPVLDAVTQLAKQSGYDLQVTGDRGALADRKVTLDTGETTFWQALDQLCAQAGLSEVAAPEQGFLHAVPQFRAPAIRIQPGAIPQLPKMVPGILPVVPPPQPPQKGPILELKELRKALELLEAQAAQAQAMAQAVAQVKAIAEAQAIAQAQGQGGAVLPVQVQPGRMQLQGIGGAGFAGGTASGQIQLKDGKSQAAPTSYAGAVRIRIVPNHPQVQSLPRVAGEVHLILEATPEPRLQNFKLVGSPRIDKATDDQGQELIVAMDPAPNAGNANAVAANAGVVFLEMSPQAASVSRAVPLRLKRGEKQAKSLKELTGSITAEALLPTEPLITMADIMKAAGKTTKGKSGGSMTVSAIEKLPNGDIQVKVAMQDIPGQNPIGNNIVIGGGQAVFRVQRVQIGGNMVVVRDGAANNSNMPKLLDAKGKEYRLAQVPEQSMHVANGNATVNVTLVYQANGADEPAQLVLMGQRTTTVQIPFSFKDVPLPQ